MSQPSLPRQAGEGSSGMNATEALRKALERTSLPEEVLSALRGPDLDGKWHAQAGENVWSPAYGYVTSGDWANRPQHDSPVGALDALTARLTEPKPERTLPVEDDGFYVGPIQHSSAQCGAMKGCDCWCESCEDGNHPDRTEPSDV